LQVQLLRQPSQNATAANFTYCCEAATLYDGVGTVLNIENEQVIPRRATKMIAVFMLNDPFL